MEKKKKEIDFQIFNKDILVNVPKIQDKTEAGIIKPDSILKEEKEKTDLFFEVLLIGENCEYVKIGDKVYIRSGKHPQVLIDEVPYLLINESNVLGKRVC